MDGNKLGKIIVGLRKSKGFTQKKLADELHVSDKSLSNWERGYSLPTIETVYLISKYFEVNFHDLMKARLEDDKNDNLVKGVIDEFNDLGNKRNKKLKKFLIVAIILIILLIIGIVFSINYNKFVVYKVGTEDSSVFPATGYYVETNQKDTLYLNNIKVKGVEIKDTDIISLDIYILEDGKEKLLNTFSRLDNVQLDNYQSYIKFDNLSKYFNKIYIRLTIIDKNNEISEYTSKLKFTKDFSNSKIYDKEENEILKATNKTPEEIKIILLNNGFKEITDNVLSKNTKASNLKYIAFTNRIDLKYEKDKLNYYYIYSLDLNRLEIKIYDKNNLEIENYKYDVNNDEVIDCITGSCNNYKIALEVLDKEILYLLK